MASTFPALAPNDLPFEEKAAFYAERVRQNPRLATILPKLTKYIPNFPTPKQSVFLTLDGHREIMYGGAAAGGKTDALLMCALQYVDVPNYAALILRRTYGQLSKADSILDRAHKWLRGTDARWEAMNNRYVWPNGAKVEFGYLQYFKDVWNYDGPAYQTIIFDELTQFNEDQYRFLFQRLRRLEGFPVPLRMRSATNPGGVGHVWVKDRFIKTTAPGRLFIPAKLTDNPHVDIKAYREMLAELDPITRKQREDGDWDAVREGTIFRREWFANYVDAIPTSSVVHHVRFWDLAATEKKQAGDDPDWTVGVLLARDGMGKFWIEDVRRFRLDPGGVQERIHSVARADGRSVPIRIEQEGGASGKSLIANFVRLLAGWNVAGYPSTGSKISRWMPLAAQCKAGNVGILNGPWNADFFEEIINVPESGHDDQADAAAGAFRYFTEEFSPIRPGVSRVITKEEREAARQRAEQTKQ
jgi:predicted phage terminase large subunit-like protein